MIAMEGATRPASTVTGDRGTGGQGDNRDNRGQTTVYLNYQTIPPFLALLFDAAFPTFRVRHAAPKPLIGM